MKKDKTQNGLHNRNSFRTISLGFVILILSGALLLMLPISSQDRSITPFKDTLFTAISASCVTGLVVRDTATHWSFFGQAVILTLIQIGGMGVITIGLMITRLSGKKVGLWFRGMMQDSISAPHVGGILQLTKFILKMTAAIELTGAVLLYPVFFREFGAVKSIWYSVFHSVSAFCNAGFDLMGVKEKFSSLTTLGSNAYANTVIMLLIIIGGIGFLTWDDIVQYKFHFKKYRLQTKVVIVTSGLLIILPAIFFFCSEYSNEPIKERILHSFFQSVTARTAGFNTSDFSKMSEPAAMVMTVLMLIGGCSGSTAGGMKTSTVAVLFLAALSVFRRKNDIECFKRRIPEDTIRTAGAILFMYLTLFMSTGIAISMIESLPLISCLFETGSALGTAGLTLGITTSLSLSSHIILMILMFAGRVGGLTLIYAAFSSSSETSRLPQEKITVG
ncbi:TrkH family potassium uptake protein [Ruminococcus flavefaciens]|uniref:Trk system potassium uptake protein TrkH n=1 Tax=Ruminococcus flavefaciens TaxID=1265 RepID=A0A1M7IA99_RUMFL|nr:potassium transporter TrkG [Ruminococcus flavefaciens]SHM37640.1 trk system potassium uptake protein TrkH [Ruminococcus flavefaciens]